MQPVADVLLLLWQCGMKWSMRTLVLWLLLRHLWWDRRRLWIMITPRRVTGCDSGPHMQQCYNLCSLVFSWFILCATVPRALRGVWSRRLEASLTNWNYNNSRPGIPDGTTPHLVVQGRSWEPPPHHSDPLLLPSSYLSSPVSTSLPPTRVPPSSCISCKQAGGELLGWTLPPRGWPGNDLRVPGTRPGEPTTHPVHHLATQPPPSTTMYLRWLPHHY